MHAGKVQGKVIKAYCFSDAAMHNDHDFYEWQEKILCEPKIENIPALTLEECQQLAEEAMKFLCVSVPIVIIDQNRSETTEYKGKTLLHCEASSKARCIWLPEWGRQAYVVLHELSHLIVGAWQGHGPQYCKVFFKLLDWIGAFREGDLIASAIEHGLVVEVE